MNKFNVMSFVDAFEKQYGDDWDVDTLKDYIKINFLDQDAENMFGCILLLCKDNFNLLFEVICELEGIGEPFNGLAKCLNVDETDGHWTFSQFPIKKEQNQQSTKVDIDTGKFKYRGLDFEYAEMCTPDHERTYNIYQVMWWNPNEGDNAINVVPEAFQFGFPGGYLIPDFIAYAIDKWIDSNPEILKGVEHD